MENISFEQELKDFFNKYNIEHTDKTKSTSDIDFSYVINGSTFWFDAKEKRQNYNMKNWIDSIPEKDCFILDELGVRKVMRHGTDGGIIIRNNMLNEYVYFSFLDLFCMPKIRVNRKTNSKGYLKGKWIINLNNGIRCNSLKSLFTKIKKYRKNKDSFFNQGKCYGEYVGENIEIRGTTRTSYYKHVDYTSTR